MTVLLLQAAFLETLAAEGEEGWAAGEAVAAPLLRRKPELAAEALALAKSKGGQLGRHGAGSVLMAIMQLQACWTRLLGAMLLLLPCVRPAATYCRLSMP